jgi:hypothetical protein
MLTTQSIDNTEFLAARKKRAAKIPWRAEPNRLQPNGFAARPTASNGEAKVVPE